MQHAGAERRRNAWSRGWLAEPTPGTCTPARGVTGPAASHEQRHRPVDQLPRADEPIGMAAFAVRTRTHHPCTDQGSPASVEQEAPVP